RSLTTPRPSGAGAVVRGAVVGAAGAVVGAVVRGAVGVAVGAEAPEFHFRNFLRPLAPIAVVQVDQKD
uniref:Histidine kinase n=1 Tax=Globodera pallida TaxID=36090 RepID=A0A183CRC5_GLOPA